MCLNSPFGSSPVPLDTESPMGPTNNDNAAVQEQAYGQACTVSGVRNIHSCVRAAPSLVTVLAPGIS